MLCERSKLDKPDVFEPVEVPSRFPSLHHGNRANIGRQVVGGSQSTDPWCRCAFQVLEQWESQQGPGSPAQTSLSFPAPTFPTPHLHRASIPDSGSKASAKPDPYDLFEKSMAVYESRRKYLSCHCRWTPSYNLYGAGWTLLLSCLCSLWLKSTLREKVFMWMHG